MNMNMRTKLCVYKIYYIQYIITAISQLQSKVKVKLSMCLTKHAMKTHVGMDIHIHTFFCLN